MSSEKVALNPGQGRPGPATVGKEPMSAEPVPAGASTPGPGPPGSGSSGPESSVLGDAARPRPGAGRMGMLWGRMSRVYQLFSARAGRRARLWTGLALLISTAVFTAAYGWVLVQRYEAFQTYAWDLGIYNQAMYTTLVHHRLLYYTADLPSVPLGGTNPGSLLAVHFSPFLYALIPFYAVAPGPATLLVLQAAALASGVIPLYLLGRRLGLPVPLAGVAGAGYLCSPVLMGIGWYDFHAEALLPATVLWALYLYYSQRPLAFTIALVVALSVIESAAPFLFLFAAAGVIAWVYAILRRRSDRPGAKERLILVISALAPLAWLFLVLVCSLLLFGGTPGDLGGSYSSDYTTLGPNLTLFTAIPYALVHPTRAAAALSYQWGDKLAYVLVLLGSLAFLPLIGPKRLLLPAAAWIGLAVLSSASGFYQFGIQFAAYPYPFLAAGAVFGLSRLWTWRTRTPVTAPKTRPRRWPSRRVPWRLARGSPFAAAGGLAVAVVVTTVLISPLNTAPLWSYDLLAHGVPSLTSQEAALHDVIDLIPSAASVLTVSAIFPEVSSRVDAFVVPASSFFRSGYTFLDALENYTNESRYILLDFSVDYFDSAVLIRYVNLTGFGLYAEDDGALLYERGWSGPPLVWVPAGTVVPGSVLSMATHALLSASAGTEVGTDSHGEPPGNATLLWTGPYNYDVPPGSYAATFWFEIDARSSGAQLFLQVNNNPVQVSMFTYGQTGSGQNYGFHVNNGPRVVLNSTEVYNPENGSFVVQENVTLDFSWSYLGVWSVAGWGLTASLGWQLNSVTLQQLGP